MTAMGTPQRYGFCINLPSTWKPSLLRVFKATRIASGWNASVADAHYYCSHPGLKLLGGCLKFSAFPARIVADSSRGEALDRGGKDSRVFFFRDPALRFDWAVETDGAQEGAARVG